MAPKGKSSSSKNDAAPAAYTRIAVFDDAAQLAALSHQLGYIAAKSQVEERLRVLLSCSNDVVYVAECEGNVVGWIHAFLTMRLESGSFCEIGGLVVKEDYRGMGIGTSLIESVVRWSSHKSAKLRVRCRTSREEAHRFYQKHRFVALKEQRVFERNLK